MTVRFMLIMNRKKGMNRIMKDLRDRAERYLAKLDERLGPLVPCATPSLPLHLRERFSVFSTRVFGMGSGESDGIPAALAATETGDR